MKAMCEDCYYLENENSRLKREIQDLEIEINDLKNRIERARMELGY